MYSKWVSIQHKLCRETRIAYLLHLLHKRLACGKHAVSTHIKYYKLTNELHSEIVRNELCGYWSGIKLIKANTASNETN